VAKDEMLVSLVELTAAGLFRIFTQFPFNPKRTNNFAKIELFFNMNQRRYRNN